MTATSQQPHQRFYLLGKVVIQYRLEKLPGEAYMDQEASTVPSDDRSPVISRRPWPPLIIGQPLEALKWSDDDLFALLKNHLAQFGDETLAAWCGAREGDLSPDSHLVSAAKGTSGCLIHKGNELLRRIGHTQHLLTA
jgi:hypothetical protein